MTIMIIIVLTTLLSIAVIGIDFQIEYTPDSLSSNGWTNDGTDTGNDMTNLKGSVEDRDGVNSLCWNNNQDNGANIDYINYNTNDGVTPELTMIVWIYPRPDYTPQGMDWLMGHDNGGYDRSIIVYDYRYNGIAMGIGGTYQSTVSYPIAGEWTSITATFSKSTNKATIYKNGGDIAAGSQQQETIRGTSGGEPKIGLNGLQNFDNHNFVGCIGRVQIINQVLTPQQVADVYNAGIEGECSEVSVCPDSSTWMQQGARSGSGTINNCEITGSPIQGTSHYGISTTWYGSSRTVMNGDYSDFTVSADFIFTKITSSWASKGALLFRMRDYCAVGGCTYGQQMSAYVASLNSAGNFLLRAHTSGSNDPLPGSSVIKIDSKVVINKVFTISVTCNGNDIIATLLYDGKEYTQTSTLNPNMVINNMYGGGSRSAYYPSGTIGFQIYDAEMKINNIKLCDNTAISAKSPQFIRQIPNETYYNINISQSAISIITILFVILLMINIICMIYMNCNKNKKRGYSKIIYDTEFVDSEANLK